MSKLYLTITTEKRQPENDGYIAAITQNHPQKGDSDITVLAITVVQNVKEGQDWFDNMVIQKPWETRQ